MRTKVQSLGPTQGVKDPAGIAMSCGVGHRHGLDPPLLWLWCRLAAAAQIQPLAWEPPYAASAALKTAKKKKKRWHMDTLYGKRRGSYKWDH